MSAVGLFVAANEFPDDGNAINQQQRLNSSISYYYATSGDLTSLSTNNAIAGADRMGYLYVPSLSPDDACNNASTPYVPRNVTRKTDLPVNFPLVAIAPWISPECTLNYLKSAQSDYTYSGALSALVFFLPNGSSSDPPPTNDPAWSLGDGGQWKKDSAFPVYAVPTLTATQVLYEMSLYSGNTSSAPFGSELRRIYGDDNFVRLWMDINIASISGTGIPSIWVFLLIILAVLLVAVGIVSGSMHLMQRRRRRALRTRIASGQIDIERLGIKAVTVPQNLIDGMALYPYKSAVESAPHDHKQASSETTEQTSSLSTGVHALHQPTCAICLDDFIESETNVRELPCRHIYHPECIDTFLRENSSLCPMCKKSTLPPGYIPDVRVTNNMVRRERALRRNQSMTSRSTRQTTDVAGGEQNGGDMPPASSNAIALEAMQPPPPSSHGRREWARRRALAMLGPHHHTASSSANGGVITNSSQAGSSPSSRPRKLLRTIFPGIG